MQMLEAGLIDYWRNKESSPAVKQCDPAKIMRISNGPRSLNLRDVQSPFLIWGVGVMLSLVTYCIENVLTSR